MNNCRTDSEYTYSTWFKPVIKYACELVEGRRQMLLYFKAPMQ